MKRALDLFCCGGGASAGLVEAGYEVTGIDIVAQPHYPYRFIRADATNLPPEWVAGFDLVWASPPCQRWSAGAGQMKTRHEHPDLIGAVRKLLRLAGHPLSVIENIPAAPLRRDVLLCGAMFGLPLIRHRIFEIHGFDVPTPEHLPHHEDFVTVTGHSGVRTKVRTDGRGGQQRDASAARWREAMGIDWLPRDRLTQAIPPAYSRYIAGHAC